MKALFIRSAVAGLLAVASPIFAAPAPPASTPKTNAPPVADYDAPYGKILEASSRPPYPFKLVLPPPNFGEVQIPSKQDLDKRGKLELLSTLSDAQIRDQLEKWPAYSKMSLGDQGAFLMGIQQYRDFRHKLAQGKAHQLGLLTLNPQQQARFEKEFSQLELQMDQQLTLQLAPAVKAAHQKMDEQLFRDFSSTGALGQKPPPAKPAPPKPAPPAPPVAVAH